MYQGDIKLGGTIDFKFCTVQNSGAPTTLAGASTSASPSLACYADNATAQILTGVTLTTDFAGGASSSAITGLNHVRIAASSSLGYTSGKNYDIVIAAGSVNSIAATGYVVGSFSIENRSALRPTTAGRTLAVDANSAVPISGHIKKNTAFAAFMFEMRDSTNHAPVTGKTLTVTRAIDGGSFVGGALANVTEIGFGIYSVDFAAADLNGNNIVLRSTAGGCDDTLERIVTYI